MRICILVGYGGRCIDAIREAAERVSRERNVSCLAMLVNQAERDESLREIESCDVVFIHSYTIPQKLENILNKLRDRVLIVSIDPLTISISNVDIDVIRKAKEYYMRGGIENYRRLILFLASLIDRDVKVEPPIEVPWHGIYHPDMGVFYNVHDYLMSYKYADRPLVGVLFYRSHWVSGDVGPIDALVRELEKAGLGVIVVFTHGHHDPLLDTPSKADSCREFFIVDGKCIIEFLIDFTSFFFANRPMTSDRFSIVSEEQDILKVLNVPVMRPILMWFRSVEEWLSSPQGVDYLTQVYQVIMPEVDGLIEPIVLAGSRRGEFGEIRGFDVARQHATYIARRVRRWVELRRKRPNERKIAIVLHNAPCKGLEANIAVGLGLDVLESVVQLLRRLKEAGYHVENVPESGRELAKLFLERRAISEFRWTSVRDIVERGGALDLVDLDTYLSWFEELPDLAKRRMIETWGDPRELVRDPKNPLAGALYDGKLVVPGLRFGNVVVLLQPKFGCAGSRCDGKVCKILHDPTIPPPHQWLAVYRWISRVFKADVVIHFGTHGYLEFRPGKGVGLSWSCWPEITIDDLPHLYVYVVTNPMEGVIAKRRGYATIIDHVYPPMSIPEVFEDLENMLAEYSRAKALGDRSRAKILLSKILEKAKDAHIEVSDNDSEDEIVEKIHRAIETVRSSQINLGLHVFGCRYDLDRAVEYAVTILHKDTACYRSIIRLVSELLGVNYDEARSRCFYIPHLGMTSIEVLKKARDVAICTLRELSYEESPSDDDIFHTVVDCVREVFRVDIGSG
ncbi:MAG: cobaltochelatase subunit CobN [Crenarchaeota archaeon]|nr:cobaltochelatase subunit CobN [Thermoproteota archaeon]